MSPIGKHVILDLSGANEKADDVSYIEQALHEAARICGATIIATKLHQFGDEGGVTGVVMLAESHITIHTWPELAYIAIDIFMCGDCNPEDAIDHLKQAFKPKEATVTIINRGHDRKDYGV